MKPRRQVSRTALELIERFEGFRAQAARLPDGRWTIGYGHTKTARQGAQVSEADAEALLIYDLLEVTAAVGDSVFAPLNQNQFDALCAFAFNVGVDNFRSSVVLRRLNEGEPLRAASALDLWRKAEVEGELILVDALVRRRAAEKALFLTPVDGAAVAPSSLIRPRLDEDAVDLSPQQEPVEVLPSLQGEDVSARRAPALALVQPVEEDETVLDTMPASAFRPARGEGWTVIADTPAAEVEPEPFPAAGPQDPPLEVPAEDAAPVVQETIETSQTEAVADATPPESVTATEAPTPTSEPAVKAAPTWAWILAVVGGIMFAIGLVWVYQGRAHGGAPSLGLGLGIVGLICLSFAGYVLLDWMGNRHHNGD